MMTCVDHDNAATALQPPLDTRVAESPVPTTAVKSASVADVMTRHPLTIDPDLPVRAAALVLFHRRIGGAPVVAASGELVGVFSEADVLDTESATRTGPRGVASDTGGHRDAPTVGDTCTRPARVTRPDASLRDAARQLLGYRIGRLVVVDDRRVVGIVTRRDVLHALIRTDVELQPLLNRALATLGEPDVAATVTWGAVTLTGTAPRRSQVPRVAAAIEAIEGIVAVDDDLRWCEDDIVPPIIPTLV
jgi:CBS domain-containing protein